MNPKDFNYDHPDRDVAAFKRAIANKLIYAVGKDPVAARSEDWWHATALAVRDQLVERWMHTTRTQYQQDVKRAYYLSMEFLIGRTFTNALLALDIAPVIKQALADFDVDFDTMVEFEPDAALGNGGLGRLAAWRGFCRYCAGPAGGVFPGQHGHPRRARLRLRHPL
jgi:glycogen phosphorylase